MRANTQQIFERMSKGGFLSVDSTDQEVKHLYDDIEENYADYCDWSLVTATTIFPVPKRPSRP